MTSFESTSTTPLIRTKSSRERAIKHARNHPFSTLFRFISTGLFAPDSTSYDPVLILLNTEDKEERDKLTRQWRDNKLSELNFVGIVSALVCGCLTSTGSWPNILPNGERSPWSVRCCWYCGIALSLTSVLCAADQTIRLHRLSTHRDALSEIRFLLSAGKTDAEGRELPRRAQVYTWQLAVLFLTASVVCMVTGMFIVVWAATALSSPQLWWDDNAKVAVTFTIVTVIAASVFFAGQVSLFSACEEAGQEGSDE